MSMLGIYCRTSKKRDEKYTLETQKEGGIKCAKSLGLEYYIYTDDGISGTKDEDIRDGLSKLFSDIKKNRITAVYCYDQSRIERSGSIWDVFTIHCLNNDVKYYPGGNFYDLEDPALRMASNMTSLFNNYYTQQTSLKVRDANAKKAAIGKTHGLKPYGLKKGIDNLYEIDEDEAFYVRLMFQMSLEGIGAYRIANFLNEKKVPTKYSGNFKDKGDIKRMNKITKEVDKFKKSKVEWRGNVVTDILKNSIYKGERIWRVHKDKVEIINGRKVKSKFVVETITGKVPAIINEDLWEKVQNNFQKNKKESVGKKAQYHYLLNGLVFCERCSNKYWGKKRLKGNDNAYKCLSKVYPNPKCDNRGLSLPKLETFVLQYLQRKPLSSSVLKALPKPYTLIDKHQEKLDEKSKELEQLSKKIKTTTSLLEKSTKIKEIFDQVESMNNKRNYLIADIAALDKKIAEEKLLNPSMIDIKEGRKKISMLSKINSDFTEIQKTVNQLVDWISIQYVNDAKPAYFKIKIKLKGLQYVDEYIVDFHLNVWEQVGYYISKQNSKGSPLINISRTSEFNLKTVSENIRLLSKSEAGRVYNNKFILKPTDIYNFD
jgi:DNA invertase Pin-like site-specific DNA recombinase